MKGILRKHSLGEKGFTLVELLVVFTLLGVLAAIMIPSISGLTNYGETQAAAAEKSIVQTAMDSMMAKENLSTVTIVATGTQDMASFPDATYALYPDYLRFSTATGNYTVVASGLITQTATGY